MTFRNAVRDVVVAALVGTATSAGLLLGMSVSWTVSITGGLLITVVLLVGDVLVFDRPAHRSTSTGKKTLAGLAAPGVLAALPLSFGLGRLFEAARSDDVYTYISAPGDGVYTSVRAAPVEGTAIRDILEGGENLYVDCSVTNKEDTWFRLIDDGGWVSEDEALPAPHTGQGLPPDCP